MSVPVPEISSIFPHKIVEGTGSFEMVIEGAGFVGNSVVKADGISLKTTLRVHGDSRPSSLPICWNERSRIVSVPLARISTWGSLEIDRLPSRFLIRLLPEVPPTVFH